MGRTACFMSTGMTRESSSTGDYKGQPIVWGGCTRYAFMNVVV